MRIVINAANIHYPFLSRRDPFLESLRTEPEFQQMMEGLRKRMGSGARRGAPASAVKPPPGNREDRPTSCSTGSWSWSVSHDPLGTRVVMRIDIGHNIAIMMYMGAEVFENSTNDTR